MRPQVEQVREKKNDEKTTKYITNKGVRQKLTRPSKQRGNKQST